MHVRRYGSGLVPGPVHNCHFIGWVCARVARVSGTMWCSVCVAHGTQGGPLFMHKVPVSHCPA